MTKLTASTRRIAALGGVLLAITAAGCLPSGTRGQGPGFVFGGPATPPAITPSPAPTGPTPRPSFVPPTPTPVPTFMVYVVAKGDSLNTIAHRFGTTARSIAFWNRSTYPSLDPESARYRPNFLKLGWTLFVRPNDVVDEQDLPDASLDAPTDAPSNSPSEADPSA
jgi:hypothetical protein